MERAIAAMQIEYYKPAIKSVCDRILDSKPK